MTAKKMQALADRVQRVADELYSQGDESLTTRAEALARLLYQKAEALEREKKT